MTSMSLDLDLTVLEDMEFAVPCEYECWDDVPCGETAEWIYLSLKPGPCGCVIPDRNFCTECKVARETFRVLTCGICQEGAYPNDLTAFRFVRIDGTS